MEVYKIKPYYKQYTYHPRKINRYFISPQPNCDTVSFCSKSENLLETSPENILTKIKKSITKDCFIGKGGEAVVYRIKGTNYCVRINNDIDIDKLSRYKSSFKTNVSEQDRVNHVVAKFGKDITIMPIISGKPLCSTDMSIDQCKRMPALIANIPIESFHKFLRQISDAHKNGMMFDCVPSNVIANWKLKTLTAIDFYKSDEGIAPMSHMFTALDLYYTNLQQKKTIAGKIFSVVTEELKPGNKPCLSPNDFDFYKFIYKLRDKKVLEDEGYVKLMVKLFNDIEELKYKELRGEDVTLVLNGKLKVVNSLIKQLFNVCK